jgi:hypothetical protein
MKYIDLIAYPIMIGVVYVLMGFARWDSNPEHWDYADRVVWILWGLAWGFALRLRILKEQGRPTWTP